MDSVRIYILTQFTSFVLLGLITYWVGQRSVCDDTLCLEQPDRTIQDQVIEEWEWEAPSEHLPYPEVRSPYYLKELAVYEEFVSSALNDLSQNYNKLYPQALLSRIEQYLHNFQNDREYIKDKTKSPESTYDQDEARLVSRNPILCLNMIWRFSNELTEIVEILKNQPYNSRVAVGSEAMEFLHDLNAIDKWPTKFTTEEAMSNFLRIQMEYNLNVDELSAGRIRGVEVAPNMDVSLMYALGAYAREQKMYTLAVPWLDLACETLNSQKDRPMKILNSKITIKTVEDQLMCAITDHDNVHPGSEPQIWQHYLYRDKLQYENQTLVEMRYPMRGQNWTHVRRLGPEFHVINHWGLCSGENHQTEKEKAKLSCWYDQTSNPALTISPMKKELLSHTPFVLQAYDVIGDSAIADIHEPIKHRMKRSPTPYATSTEDGFTIDSNIRVAVEVQLNYGLPKVDRLIELVTGLHVTTGSDIYHVVSSSAFGGHFECHVDAYNEIELLERQQAFDDGNPVATIIFHFEDIPFGGATVFPQGGVAAPPIKGSAVVWYNMKRSGDLDDRSAHCGCPVVEEHKTILPYLIGIKPQFLRYPCGLKEDE